ncbi:hypothetical protein CGK76_09960 [Erysipelotrichaceae bacterium 7770_A6]|nr:hypothetical protein [Erysipelotrichaceae bacterium 7770_A6]
MWYPCDVLFAYREGYYEDRYEYLSSSIEELASGISDMKRMLELVLDELEKHGIDIKDRQEYKDDCLPF